MGISELLAPLVVLLDVDSLIAVWRSSWRERSRVAGNRGLLSHRVSAEELVYCSSMLSRTVDRNSVW
jgi:hypothetical protein